MYLGSLESTQEARVALSCASSNSYASFVLSKLPGASILRYTHAKHEPILKCLTEGKLKRDFLVMTFHSLSSRRHFWVPFDYLVPGTRLLFSFLAGYSVVIMRALVLGADVKPKDNF